MQEWNWQDLPSWFSLLNSLMFFWFDGDKGLTALVNNLPPRTDEKNSCH